MLQSPDSHTKSGFARLHARPDALDSCLDCIAMTKTAVFRMAGSSLSGVMNKSIVRLCNARRHDPPLSPLRSR